MVNHNGNFWTFLIKFCSILPQTAVEEHKDSKQNGDFEMSTTEGRFDSSVVKRAKPLFNMFAAMLQSKVHVFVAWFTVSLH